MLVKKTNMTKNKPARHGLDRPGVWLIILLVLDPQFRIILTLPQYRLNDAFHRELHFLKTY
jgi:hypothetical protein